MKGRPREGTYVRCEFSICILLRGGIVLKGNLNLKSSASYVVRCDVAMKRKRDKVVPCVINDNVQCE